jgi:hypothetical protein
MRNYTLGAQVLRQRRELALLRREALLVHDAFVLWCDKDGTLFRSASQCKTKPVTEQLNLRQVDINKYSRHVRSYNAETDAYDARGADAMTSMLRVWAHGVA